MIVESWKTRVLGEVAAIEAWFLQFQRRAKTLTEVGWGHLCVTFIRNMVAFGHILSSEFEDGELICLDKGVPPQASIEGGSEKDTVICYGDQRYQRETSSLHRASKALSAKVLPTLGPTCENANLFEWNHLN